jgi:hypothetical protein
VAVVLKMVVMEVQVLVLVVMHQELLLVFQDNLFQDKVMPEEMGLTPDMVLDVQVVAEVPVNQEVMLVVVEVEKVEMDFKLQ